MIASAEHLHNLKDIKAKMEEVFSNPDLKIIYGIKMIEIVENAIKDQEEIMEEEFK
ncbi:hypothetical protein UFOVP1138_11 [uncultured Caudovirales phage]|uniref:Uncharacterized protein n=1 Tax=uncultured Caudovirales phage TaxID=2100421 RepID=A0A6J5PPY5_9CAUD|nr:hypothetical protein UFOVP975_20 [uncultured Caudovirales phage]CAB4186145.1 hypothetical protein UFOVP1138_11 [uncultured Caudovirales phage]CAB4204388.1 hypothetical protein UFOVP1394_8 [uncultured Caudovirales phage]